MKSTVPTFNCQEPPTNAYATNQKIAARTKRTSTFWVLLDSGMESGCNRFNRFGNSRPAISSRATRKPSMIAIVQPNFVASAAIANSAPASAGNVPIIAVVTQPPKNGATTKSVMRSQM